MKIAVGSDHRGFDVKKLVKTIVTGLGHECVDVGTDGNSPVDYPDLAYQASKIVSCGKADRAILACATGLGMCIVANKVKGIRAALCHDELSAQISRDHNDANVLCLSGDHMGEVLLDRVVKMWLNTEFSGGRHQRRIEQIETIEQKMIPKDECL